MSNDQSPQDLLADLREAYRSLPENVQVCIASLLREGSKQEASDNVLVNRR
jgi:hypothetical protein